MGRAARFVFPDSEKAATPLVDSSQLWTNSRAWLIMHRACDQNDCIERKTQGPEFEEELVSGIGCHLLVLTDSEI